MSALVLKALRQSAETHLGEKVEKAVITVPAYFGEAQCEATREAGLIAGLEVKRIIREPVAAALCYREFLKGDPQVAVADPGGGTFDITLLDAPDIDGEHQFEILSISGDGFLGGDDFDAYIATWIGAEIAERYALEVRRDAFAWQRIVEAARHAKHALSTLQRVVVSLPFLALEGHAPINVELILTRTKLEMICEELFWRLRTPCHQALRTAAMEPSDIREVLLVGGASRIPGVQGLFKEVFDRAPRTLVNPQDAVALGAAVQAGVLDGKVKDILLLDVRPHSLGIGDAEGRVVKFIERDTTIPTKAAQILSTSVDDQDSVEVQVVEGENSRTVDNRMLGRLVLGGITPARSGVPQIEITVDIDANGRTIVSAKHPLVVSPRREKLPYRAQVRGRVVYTNVANGYPPLQLKQHVGQIRANTSYASPTRRSWSGSLRTIASDSYPSRYGIQRH